MGLEFSDRQSNTVAAAITIVATLVILLAIGLLGWLAAVFLRTFSGVFLPLALGAVAALVCRPYYDWLRKTLKLPAAGAVAAVFLSVLVPLGAFATFFGGLLVGQLVELASHAPAWWESATAWVAERTPEVSEALRSSGLDERLRQAAEEQWSTLLQGLQLVGTQAFSAGLGIARGVGALLSWAVFPVYFAYFLTVDRGPLDGGHLLPFLKSDTRDDVVYLVNEFVDIIVAFFRGQLVVAFLQGLLYAAGFSLVGLSYGFAVGLVLGMLNVVPYLGSMIGLAVALPLAFFQEGGGMSTLLLVLTVFVVVQQIEGWFLTPRIMGDRTGLHFMAIIVAIFFWGSALGGILGMILAIPLTAFLATLWRFARDKYITEIV
jgi:predicted PurR-regulated permease PerM